MNHAIQVLMVILLAGSGFFGCTNEFSDHDGDTRGMVFQLTWPEDVVMMEDSGEDESRAAGVEMLAAAVDCNASGISTVRCEVYAGTETSANYLTGETFSCMAHGGRISNVSAGTARARTSLGARKPASPSPPGNMPPRRWR